MSTLFWLALFSLGAMCEEADDVILVMLTCPLCAEIIKAEDLQSHYQDEWKRLSNLDEMYVRFKTVML